MGKLKRNNYEEGIPSKKQKLAVVVKTKRKTKKYGTSGPEMKFSDVVITGTHSVVGVTISLNSIAQGLTNALRIGNKIQIKSVEVHGINVVVPNAAIAASVTKWSIVLDKEPEAGAIATYTDIYSASATNAFMNLSNSDKFVVLATGFTKIDTQIGGAAPSNSGSSVNCYNAFRKCDIATKYIGTAANQASMGSNQLLFCQVSSATSANINVDTQCRIRYTDE